jgi:hypothetical protein
VRAAVRVHSGARLDDDAGDCSNITEKQVLQRLRALALTDSIHFFKHRRITRQGFDWLATNCIDWVSSGSSRLITATIVTISYANGG